MMNVNNSSLQSVTSERLLLTDDQIATFLKDGVLVVDNFLSKTQVETAMTNGLSRMLREQYSVDTNNLKRTGSNLRQLSSTNGSGGVLDIAFYDEWKMNIVLHPTLFHWTRQLWKAGYCYNGECSNDLTPDEQFKWHPYGKFDPNNDSMECDGGGGFAYIDRICYRLPTRLAEELGEVQSSTIMEQQQDTIQKPQQPNVMTKKKHVMEKKKRALQRGLTPHLDCCPDTYDDPTNKSKWKPVQCFVSLTDNLEANTGGFEAVKGFHCHFREWTRNRPYTEIRKKKKKKSSGTGSRTANSKSSNSSSSSSSSIQNGNDDAIADDEETVISFPAPCMGEYTHIRPREDANVLNKIQHIPVRAGSVVFWDNRIPHANAYRHDGNEPRVVVYCSFLPNIHINRQYAQQQLARWKRGLNPTDQWIQSSTDQDDENADAAAVREKMEQRLQAMTPFERKLLGVELETTTTDKTPHIL